MGLENNKRIGRYLVDHGLITGDQLQDALRTQQQQQGKKLGEILVEHGYIKADELLDALAEMLEVPRARLNRMYVIPEVLELVPETLLRQHAIFPVSMEEDTLYLAMSDPLDILLIDDLRRACGFNVKPMLASREEIEDARRRHFSVKQSVQKILDDYHEDEAENHGEHMQVHESEAKDVPGVRLVNLMIAQAVRERASDIHIEPREDRVRIRFRVDGLLYDAMNAPKRMHSDIVSRIKVLSSLDITERRRPQDGRLRMEVDRQVVDLRISTLPTIFGEKVVIRLLGRLDSLLSLDELGFNAGSIAQVKAMIAQPYGLILLTGPTGSGKTTTLYSFLREINVPERNIITVEDPVEYRLEGITQVQVNRAVGVGFASGLKHVLRQDPDVIMVGEIRDLETAEIAIRSALTGHLVLSTLHTNDAAGAITRLADMGIARYLIASTMIGVVAQRLTRRLCNECKEQVTETQKADAISLDSNGHLELEDELRLFAAVGCPSCGGTGYRGRTVVEEVLVMTPELRESVLDGASDMRLRKSAVDHGMIPLRQNGLAKVRAGITTVREVMKAVFSIEDLHMDGTEHRED
jgi:type IV pilus assembly protein PilB